MCSLEHPSGLQEVYEMADAECEKFLKDLLGATHPAQPDPSAA
jgi:hypothetical protein